VNQVHRGCAACKHRGVIALTLPSDPAADVRDDGVRGASAAVTREAGAIGQIDAS
jgi:hypothetical protein